MSKMTTSVLPDGSSWSRLMECRSSHSPSTMLATGFPTACMPVRTTTISIISAPGSHASVNLGRTRYTVPISEEIEAGIEHGSWDVLDSFVDVGRRTREAAPVVLPGRIGRRGSSCLVWSSSADDRLAFRRRTDAPRTRLDERARLRDRPRPRDEGTERELLSLCEVEGIDDLPDGEALRWAADGARVPGWLDDRQAICFADTSAAIQRLMSGATQWIEAQKRPKNIIDFVRSPASRAWTPLLDRIDALLARWLSPQLEAIRGG